MLGFSHMEGGVSRVTGAMGQKLICALALKFDNATIHAPLALPQPMGMLSALSPGVR